jgi:hypothetical protein
MASNEAVYWNTKANDLQQQLNAANQRILDYESEIAAVCPEDFSLETLNSSKQIVDAKSNVAGCGRARKSGNAANRRKLRNWTDQVKERDAYP